MKITALLLGALFLIILGRAFFVPVLELSSRYCFHCGETGVDVRVVGVPVWHAKVGNYYRDGVPIPAHPHRMIESNGTSYSLLQGMEHRDEFGMTGWGARQALAGGWHGQPEQREEMVRRFMELKPWEEDRIESFIRTYGGRKTTSATSAPGDARIAE